MNKQLPVIRYNFILKLLVFVSCAVLMACSDSSNRTPVAAIVSGAPNVSSTTAVFSIKIGGSEVVAYKYSIDNEDSGAYSAEIPVATPITGTLADGEHTLRIIGRNARGAWQTIAKATTSTWTIHVVNYSYARQIGGIWTDASQGQLRGGYGIAVDATGNSYVVDQENSRVQKFAADGSFIAAWGSLGSGNTNFNYPRGIALDATYVYIADTVNHRIVKLTQNGVYQSSWSTGTNSIPSSIAYSGGTLYVTRLGSHTVIGYDTNGTQVYAPSSIGENTYAVGTDGTYVYVGCDTGRIYRLPMDLSGTTLLYDSNTDGGYTPEGIGPDGTGNIYVSFSNNTIRKINASGTRTATLGTVWSNAPGSFSGPKGVVVSSSSLYVAEYYRAQKLTLDGTSQIIYASLSDNDGYLKYPESLAFDSAGNIYVTDTYNCRIQKFATDGSFLAKWGVGGNEDGYFNRPWGIAVDVGGNVYVSDYQNDRIQKFDSNGSFLTKWGTNGNADGQLNGPTGLALDGNGNLIVMDSLNDRGQVFSATGQFVRKWGSYGSGNGQMNEPAGVVVDTEGNAYVVDVENCRVQKFSSSGAFILKWGTEGAATNQFSYPNGIARDHGGNIYVADQNNNRVMKSQNDGTYLATIGTSGSGDGQLNNPTGVWVDQAGNLYVVDYANSRIQVFQPE
jgi:tripartite motif-containing protein 71